MIRESTRRAIPGLEETGGGEIAEGESSLYYDEEDLDAESCPILETRDEP